MMKRLIPVIAILLGWASAALAAAPTTLTTMRAIHALTNAEAAQELPVAFQATVTYNRSYERLLFVQDGDAAIYIGYPTPLKLVPGDRVLVRGKTRASFNPIVVGDSITVLRHGAFPKPLPVTFDQLIRAETDCRLVTLHGVVRTADFALTDNANHYVQLKLLMDGGYVSVNLDSYSSDSPEELLDTEVELTGVSSEEFDSKMHETGALLHVQSLSDVKILQRASINPWSIPLTGMDRIITVSHIQDSTSRIRVHGSITYYQPGAAVVLQDGEKSVWIATQTYRPLRIGDEADATGFPDAHNGFLNLVHGEIRDTLIPAPVTPLPATWKTLAPRGWDSPGHYNDLVSIEGRIVTEVREAAQDEFVLETEGELFSALLRHPDGLVKNRREIPLGSKVRVTGICILENSDPYSAHVPFNILLRSLDDIVVVAKPSMLNIRNLILIVGILLVVVFAVIARGWLIERNVRRQTTTLAEIERQRSRILEDINGSRPLAEILEGIAVMVSSTLEGAPCWCEVADGETLGACPKEPHGLRIVRAEIPARSGPALGALYVGLDPRTPPLGRETAALQNGARLATLAMETRRLYTDLRRRSEFDLLTDIPNRFAMEKFMELQIEEARLSGRILGLIYIDLDKFKPINDTYGHHVGDLFLQAVALRMSRQLLGGDMLARLGGDEFAALVSLHHGRSDLDKIIARLESCFDEPFSVEGNLLHGEASIGFALFPEDGATKDSLLNAADAAMYAVKNRKKNFEKSMEPIFHSEL
jgi:diguanylate cyclase (GGDEF)-like protein